MVADLIRDSPFGHIVRLVTGRKVFQYPEEKDPNLWKKYVHEEKSGYMAHHGTAQPPEEKTEELNNLQGVRSRENPDNSSDSSRTIAEGHNEASGARVDPEKGKDKHVIDWYGPDDPQVCVIVTTEGVCHADRGVESAKLVTRKEVLRHFRDLLFDIFGLHWISNLHAWPTRRCRSLWCRTGSRDARSDPVRGRLWSWSHHLVSHVGDPPNRTTLGVHPDAA